MRGFALCRPPLASSFSLSCLAVLILASSACVHTNAKIKAEEYQQPMGAAPRTLLEDAEARLEKGDITMAHSQAERVYRMQPNDYRVLFLLARIARASESPGDAEQWAYKALEALQPQNLKEQRQLWDFIAVCRQEADDEEGAAAAQREADQVGR